MTYLDAEQVDLLLKPIHPKRVLTRQSMAYVEAHDIKAELNRVFGFARWSSEVVEQQCLFDDAVMMNNEKPGFNVAYRSIVKLTVSAKDGTQLATYTEGHVGDSTHPVRSEAHGNALTNSESYALKRCAVMLGDQFGLSLYNKGSKDPIVRWTLLRPEKTADDSAEDREPAEVKPESLEPDPVDEPRTTNGAQKTDFPEKRELAESIKERIESGPLDMEPKGWIAALMKEAAAGGVLSVIVEDYKGTELTVNRMIMDASKTVAGAR